MANDERGGDGVSPARFAELTEDSSFRGRRDYPIPAPNGRTGKFSLRIDDSAARHVMKGHGPDSEAARNGRPPVTYDDFDNLLAIVRKPDSIRKTDSLPLAPDRYVYEGILAGERWIAVTSDHPKKRHRLLITFYRSDR